MECWLSKYLLIFHYPVNKDGFLRGNTRSALSEVSTSFVFQWELNFLDIDTSMINLYSEIVKLIFKLNEWSILKGSYRTDLSNSYFWVVDCHFAALQPALSLFFYIGSILTRLHSVHQHITHTNLKNISTPKRIL